MVTELPRTKLEQSGNLYLGLLLFSARQSPSSLPAHFVWALNEFWGGGGKWWCRGGRASSGAPGIRTVQTLRLAQP